MVDSNSSSTPRNHPYFATFFVLVAVILLCALGTWQMQRGEDKQTRLNLIEQRQNDAALSLRELLDMEDKRDLPFELSGVINANRIFLLDNRIEEGQVGYQVLAPLDSDFGVQIVNFGWIKAGRSREELPKVSLDTSFQQYRGVSSVPNINPMISETATKQDAWPMVIQQIDLPLMSEFLGSQLSPVVLQLAPDEQSGFARNWKPVVMSPQKHYGYAVQWFGLAIACLVIYIVALIKRKP